MEPQWKISYSMKSHCSYAIIWNLTEVNFIELSLGEVNNIKSTFIQDGHVA